MQSDNLHYEIHMVPHFGLNNKAILAHKLIKELFPTKKLKTSNCVSLLYPHFERRFAKSERFLFQFQRSLLMHLTGKRNPAANTSPSSYHWSATTGAWSHSLTWLVGSWCACLHYNASLLVPTYPSLDFLLFYYSSSNTASETH